MQFHRSAHAGSLRPTAANKILDMGADPAIISLAAGNPAPEAYPIAAVQDITRRILEEEPLEALQYSVPQGDPSLRRAVTDWMRSRYDCGREFDDCVIVSGAQQGGDLTARILCDPGDIVLCEEPTFLGCLDAFRAAGAQLRGVPMQEDGIDVDALEAALREGGPIRFLYTIPNFQNPTGITMSMEKRRRVYELAVQYDILILEDNPYGDLRFRGEALPPIKSLDETGHVIYMGSFSKILAPGVRTGYVLAHRDLIAQYTTLKSACDVHSNILAQKTCYRFLTEQDMDAHLAGLAAVYRRKSTLMLDAFDRCFDSRVTRTEPDGGLFVWCTLPEGCDSQPFAASAAEAGVLVVPGAGFMTDPETISRSFRLNYSTPSDEAILRGMEILGRLTHSL